LLFISFFTIEYYKGTGIILQALGGEPAILIKYWGIGVLGEWGDGMVPFGQVLNAFGAGC
jgi:hypothetical protein